MLGGFQLSYDKPVGQAGDKSGDGEQTDKSGCPDGRGPQQHRDAQCADRSTCNGEEPRGSDFELLAQPDHDRCGNCGQHTCDDENHGRGQHERKDSIQQPGEIAVRRKHEHGLSDRSNHRSCGSASCEPTSECTGTSAGHVALLTRSPRMRYARFRAGTQSRCSAPCSAARAGRRAEARWRSRRPPLATAPLEYGRSRADADAAPAPR